MFDTKSTPSITTQDDQQAPEKILSESDASANLSGEVDRFNSNGVLIKADGGRSFISPSGKTNAEVQFAQIGQIHFAEYRFQILCGGFQGSALPITKHSERHGSNEAAMVSALTRLIMGIEANCDIATLSKVQLKEVATLRAWAESERASYASKLPLVGKTFLDVCAGTGGMHIALHGLGARCVGAVEIDRDAQLTYRLNFGNDIPIHSDIRHVKSNALPHFDILAAGIPCQPFSVAGKKSGFADTDQGLIYQDVVRLAADGQPEAVILENVEPFASMDGGKVARTAMNALGEAGYCVSLQSLDAAAFDTPQQRKRVFIVGIRADLYQTGVPYTFPKGTEPGRVVADIVEQGITSDRCSASYVKRTNASSPGKDRLIVAGHVGGKDMQGYRVYSPIGKGVTLCASSGGPGRQTGLYLIDGEPRRLTPRECARMQGYPDSYRPHPSRNKARKQFGNAVAVPVVAAVANAVAKFL